MSTKIGTGIFIGRFQVFELTEEHKRIMDQLLAQHKRVIVYAGVNPAPSDRNPLDWQFRASLFEPYASRIEMYEMPDLPDDRIWSQELDRRILDLRPGDDVTLYGTSEGFVDLYSGRYRTAVLEADTDTDLPGNPKPELLEMRSFRAGIIYATLRRFPTVYATVDMALLRNNRQEVLLARKDQETLFRFPGGFADPMDLSFEMAALRELMEECGDLEVANFSYLGSCQMDDWRYRDTMDSVITHFYACDWIEGEPEPDDDIVEVKWVEIAKLRPKILVEEHRALIPLLEEYLVEEEE